MGREGSGVRPKRVRKELVELLLGQFSLKRKPVFRQGLLDQGLVVGIQVGPFEVFVNEAKELPDIGQAKFLSTHSDNFRWPTRVAEALDDNIRKASEREWCREDGVFGHESSRRGDRDGSSRRKNIKSSRTDVNRCAILWAYVRRIY